MDQNVILTDSIITKYNNSALICGNIYIEIKNKIIDGETNVTYLSDYGNKRILQELSKIYKRETDKNIAFPVSISLNNYLSNCINGIINEDDVIKIEMGVSISGYISILAETFTIKENKSINQTNKFLNNLKEKLLLQIMDGETADEIRINIESECTKHGLFPTENCISFQQQKGYISTSDSKYMILNYKKHYDKDDNLISKINDNYEFEEFDIYTINLSVTKEMDNIIYKNENKTKIYSLNEFNYSLKLKNSREFYNQIKNSHLNYAFISDNSIKSRIGIKEMINAGILEEYPVLSTNGVTVITKKFTIIIGKDKSKSLKYFS